MRLKRTSRSPKFIIEHPSEGKSTEPGVLATKFVWVSKIMTVALLESESFEKWCKYPW